MSKNFNYLILILGVVLLLSGCSKDEGTTGNPFGPPQNGSTVASYFPLKVGNTWNYEWAHWPVQNDTATGTFSISVDDSQAIFSSAIAYHTTSNAWLVTINGELRIYNQAAAPTENSSYFIWMKEPLTAGNAWYNDHPIQPDSSQSQIGALNASVTVPAGNFTNCLKIDYSTIDSDYFAPGIGYARYIFTSPSEYYEEKLVSHNL
jgi:hypothetical protein